MHGRNAQESIEIALGDTPVVLLQGARQVGKTTLVQALSADVKPPRRVLTLDDGAVLSAAQRDPEGFVAALTGPSAIDEVQRAPELFRAIKASVDRDRTPGRFLLTGSANVMLLPKLSESLAGRVELIPLWPLSQGEFEGVRERFIDRLFERETPDWKGPGKRSRPVAERMLRGGFPEASSRADAVRRDAWFSAYAETTLRREVRELSGAEGLAELPRLLAALAARAGGLLNVADVSRALGMPQSTTRRYIALLEATFLAVMVPAWSTNRSSRLAKSAKVLVADSGLACHLVGANADRLAEDGPARGAMLENFLAMEIIKQRGWSQTKPAIHHFRSAAGAEVDLVLEDRAGRVVGIEFKSARSVGADAFRGLRALRELAGKNFVRGVVLHDGVETVRFDPTLMAAPHSAAWSGD
jgi:predicted AAA+ superfamily ATPase